MNDLIKTTITTLEIAGMMEVPHCDILKKLEGRKDRKGYIQIMTEGQMSVSDFFIPSTYRDSSGKENKCYEVTKLGCDFLANKFTGKKGILFTARYVKRFHEMKNQIKQIPLTERPDRVAQLINAVSPQMKRNGSTPYDITKNTELICEQYGIRLIENFAKIPEYCIKSFFETKEEEKVRLKEQKMKETEWELEEDGVAPVQLKNEEMEDIYDE